MRQRLCDLPIPPEVAEEAKQYIAKLHMGGWGGVAHRRDILEDMLLQYYYGGNWVGYLRSPQGKVVVAVGMLDEAFNRQLDALSPEERRQVSLYPALPWHDEMSLL